MSERKPSWRERFADYIDHWIEVNRILDDLDDEQKKKEMHVLEGQWKQLRESPDVPDFRVLYSEYEAGCNQIVLRRTEASKIPDDKRRGKALAKIEKAEAPEFARLHAIHLHLYELGDAPKAQEKPGILRDIATILYMGGVADRHEEAAWRTWLAAGATDAPPPTEHPRLKKLVALLLFERVQASKAKVTRYTPTKLRAALRELDPGDGKLPDDLRGLIEDLPPDDTPDLREAYRRDHLWLKWHSELRGAVRYINATIRDQWNKIPDAHRKIIAPRCSHDIGNDRSGAETVRTGLTKARNDLKKRKARSVRKGSSKSRSSKET